ncbi:MAG TPA: HAD-IIIA family hydrolase [Phnomibacter sp.]|nr:HAD-IIIA family hydrolase [Phnomibacter sp.]
MLHLFEPIKAFVFDVDGVLTDGTLILMPGGEMVRRMHIKDGYALQLAVKQGYQVAIISGGKSELVQERLQKLGVQEVYMQVADKRQVLLQFMQRHGLQPQQVLFMGDDMPDLEALQLAGLPCAPADACPEVIAASKYVCALPGGSGCARDVIEKVLKLNGHWTTQHGLQSR